MKALRLVVLSAVLSAVVPSWSRAAPISEKAAVAQAKAAAKTRLGLLKGALAAAQATALAAIDAVDVANQNGPFTVLGTQTLVDDLAALQASVEEALFHLAVDTANDGQAALAALADGTPLSTLPLALANGVGGLPDQERASAGKLLAKTYRTIDKRLAKSGALVARTTTGASLFAVVDPPPQLFFAFSDQHGDSILFSLAVDLRVSASTTPTDGRIWIGGTSNLGGQALVVSALAMTTVPTEVDQQVTTTGRGRFVARLGDSATLPRDNYLLGVVTPTTPSASASSAFTLR